MNRTAGRHTTNRKYTIIIATGIAIVFPFITYDAVAVDLPSQTLILNRDDKPEVKDNRKEKEPEKSKGITEKNMVTRDGEQKEESEDDKKKQKQKTKPDAVISTTPIVTISSIPTPSFTATPANSSPTHVQSTSPEKAGDNTKPAENDNPAKPNASTNVSGPQQDDHHKNFDKQQKSPLPTPVATPTPKNRNKPEGERPVQVHNVEPIVTPTEKKDEEVTPEPTDIPASPSSSQPSITPEPTSTPEPISSPRPTDTPEPTPTEKAKPTGKPRATRTPDPPVTEDENRGQDDAVAAIADTTTIPPSISTDTIPVQSTQTQGNLAGPRPGNISVTPRIQSIAVQNRPVVETLKRLVDPLVNREAPVVQSYQYMISQLDPETTKQLYFIAAGLGLLGSSLVALPSLVNWWKRRKIA
jgi:hypothetical protein